MISHCKKSLLFLCLCGMVLALEVTFKPTQDYCDASLCKNQMHVACEVKGIEYGNGCPIDANLVFLSTETKLHILWGFNYVRNSVAEGRPGSFPPAARMATMEWDEELAYIAQTDILRCTQDNGLCRNTARYKNVGLTIDNYDDYDGNENQTIDKRMDPMVHRWLEQSSSVTLKNIILKYSEKHGKNPLAQLFVENSNKVGCAVLKQSMDGRLQTSRICNYNYSPKVGKPLYNVSRIGGGSCKTGNTPLYKNLCSVKESYEVNESPKTKVTDKKSVKPEESSTVSPKEAQGKERPSAVVKRKTTKDIEYKNAPSRNEKSNEKYELNNNVVNEKYIRKFDRLRAIIKNATRLAKKRRITIITSNHEIDVEVKLKHSPEEELITQRTKRVKNNMRARQKSVHNR